MFDAFREKQYPILTIKEVDGNQARVNEHIEACAAVTRHNMRVYRLQSQAMIGAMILAIIVATAGVVMVGA